MAAVREALEFDSALRMRLRVEILLSEYAISIDDDRLEQWPEFFTERGRYEITSRENVELGLPSSFVFCEGRGMMADRITAMRTANIFEPHVYCHTGGALRITGMDGRGCTAESSFTVVRTMADGAMSVFAAGRYFDRIVDDGGRLLFAQRKVVLDSRRIDTLLVIPL